MNIRYAKGRNKGFLRKYWGLSRLAWEELKIGGFSGAVFAVRRHLKKRKGRLRGVFSNDPHPSSVQVDPFLDL